MIVKVKSPKSLQRVLSYNLNKVEKGVGAVLYTQGLYNPSEQALTAESAYGDMIMQIPSKTRVKNIAFSCSLNPDPSESVSDELYIQIAQEFMERMGYGKQPFVVIKHWDIPRQHIHIVSTRVDKQGKKISDKHEGRKARKVINALERKYNLKLTQPNTNGLRREKTSSKKVKPIDMQEGKLSEQIYSVALHVIEKGSFQSIGGLNALLAPYNLSAKITKSERKGKQYDGIVYIPMEGGKPIAPPIPSKGLGRGVGHTAVKTKMYKSAKRCKEKAVEMRETVARIMLTQPQTLEQFSERLNQYGIELEAKRNDKGRIYGATFVSRNDMVAISGSKLGSDFSANTLNNMFGTTEGAEEKKKVKTITKQHGRYTTHSATHSNSNRGGDDWKEISWQKYLRKKYSTDTTKRKL